MKWKDKDGKELTGKEFLERWKGGIEKVTALEKARIQVIFTIIILIGLIIGVITAIITKVWWLLIVLIGAFGINIISFITTLQQYLAFKKIENIVKGGENGI